MPHVIVKLRPGRTEEQKHAFAESITKNMVDILGAREAAISIAFEEVTKEEWQQKVVEPDILPKWDQLYKKPEHEV